MYTYALNRGGKGVTSPADRLRGMPTKSSPSMRTRFTLPPDQRGAQQLLAQSGTCLVCVRHRYDEQHKKRFKTGEFIVEESEWAPPTSQRSADSVGHGRVAVSEDAVRRHVKGAGGKWNPQQGVWELPYERVVAFGLSGRVGGDNESI
jgi:hypothetical protein